MPDSDDVRPPPQQHLPGVEPAPDAASGRGPTATASAGSTGQPAHDPPAAGSGEDAPLPGGRWRDRLAHPQLRTRRGLLLGLALAIGFTGVAVIVGLQVVHYSESTEFCTLCHTMIPQEKAHEAGSHQGVECGTCHVEPGVVGFVKAKLAGTKELYHLVTDSYPTPIHGDRGRLPTVAGTCMTCHSQDTLTRGAQSMQLILRPDYKADRGNTAGTIALALKVDAAKRAVTGDSTSVGGVHWHITQQMRYVRSGDPNAQIDLVEWTDPQGEVHTYLGSPKIGIASNVAPDLASLTEGAKWQQMDCIDCHNRVGHPAPSVDATLDQAMAAGTLDPGLPYIKRQGAVLLGASYDSAEQAQEKIALLPERYAAKYPLVAQERAAALDQAVATLTAAQAQLSTPEMKVIPSTYADNLGHQSSPGCFRCHDGAHFEVVDDVVTKGTISSSCATCHTFPQSGPVVSELPVGEEPPTHADDLWVFSHKFKVSSVNPEGTDCGSCHTRNYCANCHQTGASKVNHDEMMYNHAASIRKSGISACASCHQSYLCQTCHAGDPLGTGKADGMAGLPPPIPAGQQSSRAAQRAPARHLLGRR